MEHKHVLGMVCGYYLSRFDDAAYSRLGYTTQKSAHEALAKALSVPVDSIKNWRDEFDPVHENQRKGWRRRGMYPSRRRTIEALSDLTESELFSLVCTISQVPDGVVANDLVSILGDVTTQNEDDQDTYGLRGPTGVKAELIYMKYHERFHEPLPGTLLDRRYEQCGFDFEIRLRGRRIVVEVKGVAGDYGGVTFTDKEWDIARQMGDAYYLALVRNVASEPEISLIRNPANRLCAHMRTYTTIQVGWSVAHGALTAAERRSDS